MGMASSLTCRDSPGLTTPQERGGDEQSLHIFIRDLTALIYWQKLPLAVSWQLILWLLCARLQGKQNKEKVPSVPAGQDFIICSATQGACETVRSGHS